MAPKARSKEKVGNEAKPETAQTLKDDHITSKHQLMEQIKLRKEIVGGALQQWDQDIVAHETTSDIDRKKVYVRLLKLQQSAETDQTAKNEWSRLCATWKVEDPFAMATQIEKISSHQRRHANMMELVYKYLPFTEFTQGKVVRPAP